MPTVKVGVAIKATFESGNIRCGEPIKRYGDIRRGDIITYKSFDERLIKRVVAIEGDCIQIIDGRLYVNGLFVDRYPIIDDAGMINEPFLLGKEELFCIGDNINRSTDSRFLGPVQFNDVECIIDID